MYVATLDLIYASDMHTGKFGVVYKGWYTNKKKATEVAIKTMKGCLNPLSIIPGLYVHICRSHILQLS